MLFINEKIGAVSLHIHNCYPGSKTNWLILTNSKDEEIGKLLVNLEIKRDTTQRQLRLIQKDLSMQDKVPTVDDPGIPGINIDMTEDKGMPLRNHEQVLLLNEKKEQVKQQFKQQLINYNEIEHQSNDQTYPMARMIQNNLVRQSINQNLISGNSQVVSQQTQETQITHVTHQTQNSAIIGSIGEALQPQQQVRIDPHQSHHLKSINLSILTCLNQPSKGILNAGTANNIQKLKSSKLNITQQTQKQSRLATTQITQSQAHQRNERNQNPSSIILKNEKIDTSSQSHGLGGNPSAFGGFYLETTNIITTNKQEKKNNKKNGLGAGRSNNDAGDFVEIVGNNHTVNHKESDEDDDDEEDEDDEYDEEDDYDEEDNYYFEIIQKPGENNRDPKYYNGNQYNVNQKMLQNRNDTAEYEVAQIEGTGGNLQTHYNEEEDEEYEDDCAGEEDDEIDSEEEGLNSLQLAFGQPNSQQNRNSLNILEQNNYFHKINSEQVKKTRENSKNQRNRYLVSTSTEPAQNQSQFINNGRNSYISYTQQKQYIKQSNTINKIGRPPKKDQAANLKYSNNDAQNNSEIQVQYINYHDIGKKQNQNQIIKLQTFNEKVNQIKNQGFGQKMYIQESNSKETPPVNEGGGVSQSTVGQNSNVQNSVSQNSKINTNGLVSQKSEKNVNNQLSSKNSNYKLPQKDQTDDIQQKKLILIKSIDNQKIQIKSGKQLKKGKQRNNEIDQDDESNINSDEQDEYLECQIQSNSNQLHNDIQIQQVQIQNQSASLSNQDFKKGYLTNNQNQKNTIRKQLTAIHPVNTTFNGIKLRSDDDQQIVIQQQRPLTAQARNNYQTQNVNQRQIQFLQQNANQFINVFQTNDSKDPQISSNKNQKIEIQNQIQRNNTQQNFRNVQGINQKVLDNNIQKQNIKSGYIIGINQLNELSPQNKDEHFQYEQDIHQQQENRQQSGYERVNINQNDMEEPSFRQRKSIFQKTIQQKGIGLAQSNERSDYKSKQAQVQMKQKQQNQTVQKQILIQANTPGITRTAANTQVESENYLQNRIKIMQPGRNNSFHQQQRGYSQSAVNNRINNKFYKQNNLDNIEVEQLINNNKIFLIEPQIDHHSISYMTNKAQGQLYKHQTPSNLNNLNIEIENQQSNSILSQNKRNMGRYVPQESIEQIQYARTQHTPSQSNQNIGQPQFKIVKSKYVYNYDKQLPTQPNQNIPTMTTQQHFYSQNTNVIHTQEAQQETNQQNYYDDFGDQIEKLGEIDDEELLNQQDQQAEDIEQFYEEYDGPEQEIIPDPVVENYNYKNQVQIETSKKLKNRRRQPSQEPITLPQDSIQEYQIGQIPSYIQKENEKDIQYISNGTAYIGQNSNTLEQETFLMQHDTFQGQADANDMPDFSTQSQKLDEIEITSFPNNKSTHQQAFQQKLLSQQQQKMVYSLGFQTDVQNKKINQKNTQINLYQKIQKKEKIHNRQLQEDQNEVFYLVNNSALNYIKNDIDKDDEEIEEQKQQNFQKYIQLGKKYILSDDNKQKIIHRPEDNQILIQHITQHSQESDSLRDPIQGKENEILIIGNPNRYMKLKNNWKSKKKNSNGLTIGGTIQSTKVNNQGESNIGLDTISQDGRTNNYQGGQQTFMQQYNTYQDSRDQMMDALNINQPNYNEDKEKDPQQTTQYKKSKSQISSIPIKQQQNSASTQQILNTLNFQNSRALNHEIALNQMQKNLLEQFQRVKEMKRDTKIKKIHVEEQIKQYDQKKLELETQNKKFEQKKSNFKKEKKQIQYQNQKLLEIHKQYVDLLRNKQIVQKEIYAPIDVSEKLNNIQTILEIILKDKQSQGKSSQSSKSSDSEISQSRLLNKQSLQVLQQINQQNLNDLKNLQQISNQEDENKKLEVIRDLQQNIDYKEQKILELNEDAYPQLNYQANLSQQIYLNDQSQIQEYQNIQQQPQHQLQLIVQQYQSKLNEINDVLRNLQSQNPQINSNYYQQSQVAHNNQQIWNPLGHQGAYKQIGQQIIGQQGIYQAQPSFQVNQNLGGKVLAQNPSNLLSYELTTHKPILTIGATPTETINSSIDHTQNNKIFVQQRFLHQHSSQLSNVQVPQTYFTPIQGSYNHNFEMFNSKHLYPNNLIDLNVQNYDPRIQQQEIYNRQFYLESQNAFNLKSQQEQQNQIKNELVQEIQSPQEDPFKLNQNQHRTNQSQNDLIANNEINQNSQTLNSKKEMKKQSTEVQSEFVFDPDPDFLSKINQNIRQNNQIIDENFKIPENNVLISPQKFDKQIINNILNPIIQKKQQNLIELQNDNLNEDKIVQNMNKIDHIEYEKQKLISCGSDIQIQEGDFQQEQVNQQQKEDENQQESYLRQQLYLLQEQQFQHAYTDRNHFSSSQNSLQNFKDNLGQATQVDINFQQQQRNIINTQAQNPQKQIVDTRNLQQNSGGNSSQLSQIPSSQMSAFQSIQQKLNRIIGSNINQSNVNQSSNIKENLTNNNYQSNFMYSNNGSQPDNEHFYLQGKSYGIGNDQRDSEGQYQIQRKQDQNQLYSCNQIINKNQQFSSSLVHTPSIGQSPAIIISKQNINIQTKITNQNDQPIQMLDLEINNQILKQNEANKNDKSAKKNEKEEVKSNQKVKKIEEDEILRLIHESQEAQEWSESQSYYESSHNDTFNKRPQAQEFKLLENNQDLSQNNKLQDKNTQQNQVNQNFGKHQQNQSVEYNEKGEVYDQPKKAIYGIKIAKNAF